MISFVYPCMCVYFTFFASQMHTRLYEILLIKIVIHMKNHWKSFISSGVQTETTYISGVQVKVWNEKTLRHFLIVQFVHFFIYDQILMKKYRTRIPWLDYPWRTLVCANEWTEEYNRLIKSFCIPIFLLYIFFPFIARKVGVWQNIWVSNNNVFFCFNGK